MRGRQEGDTNMQLSYRPRPSRRMECEHELSDIHRVGNSVLYWFRYCDKCQEVEWVG
jgi:hypothetical protein